MGSRRMFFGTVAVVAAMVTGGCSSSPPMSTTQSTPSMGVALSSLSVSAEQPDQQSVPSSNTEAAPQWADCKGATYAGFPLLAVKNGQGSAYLCWKSGRYGADQTVVYADSTGQMLLYNLQSPDGTLQLSEYGDSKDCVIKVNEEAELSGNCGAAFPVLSSVDEKWISPLFIPAMRGEDVTTSATPVLTVTSAPVAGTTSKPEDRKPLNSLPEGDICRYVTRDMVAAAFADKWDPSVAYTISEQESPAYIQELFIDSGGTRWIQDKCTVYVEHPQLQERSSGIEYGGFEIRHRYKEGTEGESEWDGSSPENRASEYSYDGRLWCEKESGTIKCLQNPNHILAARVVRPNHDAEPDPHQDALPQNIQIRQSVAENLMTQFLDNWQANN